MANDPGQTADTRTVSPRELSPQNANRLPATPWLVLIGVLSAVAIWAYWPSIADILAAWISNPDYTHGFFVVPISLWLLWVRRGQAPNIAVSPDWRGLVLLIMAALVRVAAGRFYLPQLDAWSIPLWVGGIVWLFFGWAVFRWAIPSIAFLWFATPLPGTIEIALSTPLQRLAAGLSAFVLRILGQPALVEGTTILLDNQVLDVERACSGLRMFYGIFALAVACIALARPARWKAILVLLSAAPVAILANVVRIVATGLLMKYTTSETAQKFSHDLAGLVMIPLAVGLFLLFLMLLSRIVRRWQEAGRVAWLTKWGLAILLVGGLLIFWGRRQEAQAITTLRDSAARFESEKDWSRCIQYLSRYLRAQPDDDAAFTHMAEIYRDRASSYQDQLRASELMRNAWRRQPEKEELAIGAVRLSLRLQEFDQAIPLCDELLAKSTDKKTVAEATNLRAEALIAYLQSDKNQGDYTWDHVRAALEKAVKLPGYEVGYASALADVYRQQSRSMDTKKREKLADDLIDRVVSERKDDPLAWLARFQYHVRYGAPVEKAEPDLTKALDLAEKQTANAAAAPVLLVGAMHARSRGDIPKATKLLETGIERAPTDYRSYLMLADLKQSSGKPQDRDAAIKVLQDGISKTGSKDLTLALPLASLLADSGKIDEAEAQIAPIEAVLPRIVGPERGTAKLSTGVVRARIISLRKGVQEALAYLRELLGDADVRLTEQRIPQTLAQGYALMGRFYLALSSPDLALDAFRRAGRLDPSNLEWQMQSATLAKQVGDFDSADRDLQMLIDRGAASDKTRSAAVEVEIHRQLQRPVKDRDWTKAKQLIQAARQAGASELTVRLFAADILAASGELEKAEQMIKTLTEQHPKDLSAWRSLTVVRMRRGDPDGAFQAAEQFADVSENKVDAAILRASLLSETKKTDEAVKVLTEAADKAPVEQLPQVALSLAQLLNRLGRPAEAIAALEKAHERAPRDLQIVDFLATMAWLGQDWKAQEKYESWIRTIEGDEGTIWKAYRVQRLLSTVASTDSKEFQDAAADVDVLVRVRPRWSKSQLLKGEIDLRRNQIDAAAEAYEKAWELGGRGVLLADRLMDTLTRQGRADQARKYADQARDYLAYSPGLFDRAIPLLEQGNPLLEQGNEGGDMVQLAQKWVDEQPENPDGRMRLGRVLLMRSQASTSDDQKQKYFDQAKSEFRRAIDLAPTDVRTWVANVLLYAQSDQTREQANQVIQEFATQSKIDELERTFVLAQMHQVLGQMSQAQLFYQQAGALAQANPKSSNAAEVLGKVSRFFLTRVSALAEMYARQSSALDAVNPDARFVLLYLLANRSDKESMLEALRMLDESATKNAIDSSTQNRLRATLLVRRNGPGDLEAAITALQQTGAPTREDKLLLARVYERAGRITPALDIYQQLIRSSDVQPGELVEFIGFWQQQFLSKTPPNGTPQFAAQAREAYERLGNLPGQLPEQLRWRIRELRARDPKAEISTDKVLALVSEVLGTPTAGKMDETELRRTLQTILIVLLQENCGASAIELAAKPPNGIVPAEAAAILCHSFVVVPVAKDNQAMVATRRKTIETLLGDHSGNANVVQAVGDCTFMAADYETAVKAYQQVLQLDAQHAMTRNNLALALAESGRVSEAREVLAVALQADPKNVDLIDTQATIEIADKHPEKAVPELEKIKQLHPESAIPRLHLAIAYDDMHDAEHARDNVTAAASLGIQQIILSPSDRDRFVKLYERYIVSNKNAVANAAKPTDVSRD